MGGVRMVRLGWAVSPAVTPWSISVGMPESPAGGAVRQNPPPSVKPHWPRCCHRRADRAHRRTAAAGDECHRPDEEKAAAPARGGRTGHAAARQMSGIGELFEGGAALVVIRRSQIGRAAEYRLRSTTCAISENIAAPSATASAGGRSRGWSGPAPSARAALADFLDADQQQQMHGFVKRPCRPPGHRHRQHQARLLRAGLPGRHLGRGGCGL